ncbi:NAC domain-containing protein 83-like [Cucurbita moschata]|uniref:NAC domain-containing protein 83-like n=1 Tax=Cucurbita moschata TaxID=3662 RepID=A0A6J1EM62_CUCMO|nr:NAC domain-containing protein 83-like [Cucurbita moschata]
MDKLKFGRDGMRGLPPGFRFQPTEEELVFEYLKCKVFSCALPASIIPEVNVCHFDPWEVPGGDWEVEQRCTYLFINKEETGKKNGRWVWTPSGYWKAKPKGRERRIVSSSSSSQSVSVGMKKTLVFYANNRNRGGSRTGWVMHQYRLIATHPKTHTPTVLNNMNKWAICRIFWRKLQSNRYNHHLQLQYYSMSTNHSDGNASASAASPAPSTTSSSSSTSTSFFASSVQQKSDDDFSAS